MRARKNEPLSGEKIILASGPFFASKFSEKNEGDEKKYKFHLL